MSAEIDAADLIAGATGCSRGFAYTLMEQALEERDSHGAAHRGEDGRTLLAAFERWWYGQDEDDRLDYGGGHAGFVAGVEYAHAAAARRV